MPQLVKGGLVMFRRMFLDNNPRLGEIVFIGFNSVVVKTGIGTTDEKLFVDLDQICRVL